MQELLTSAERARTIIASSTAVRIGVLNHDHPVTRHAVAPDGSVLLMAPAASPLRMVSAARGLRAPSVDLTADDLCHVPQPDRLRGTLVLSGRIGPIPHALPIDLVEHLRGPDLVEPSEGHPVLRIIPRRVWVSWSCETRDAASRPDEVSAADYRAAAPDPLFDQERRLLPHLLDAHPDLLELLARRAAPELADADVRPVALDRHGIVLRYYTDGARHDRRVAFDRPATCGCELRHEFAQLAHAVGSHGPIDFGHAS